nr:EOG090X0J8E [Polyphemus pediculus]
MLHGSLRSQALDSLSVAHPLQEALIKHNLKKEELSMNMLRRIQGLHAPLRLNMEKRAMRDVGHLPCLYRHNAMLDALTGNDMNMDFEDFLNHPRESEAMGMPSLMIEKQFRIL